MSRAAEARHQGVSCMAERNLWAETIYKGPVAACLLRLVHYQIHGPTGPMIVSDIEQEDRLHTIESMRCSAMWPFGALIL